MLDYIWKDRYEAALIETDPIRLKIGIRKARAVMLKRLKVLGIHKYPTAMREYEAIQDAEAQLKVIERLPS